MLHKHRSNVISVTVVAKYKVKMEVALFIWVQ